MHIKNIISQHRRDFTAIYKCEHCNSIIKGRGYDDRNFHENVIPSMICLKCGKKGGKEYKPLAPKYPDGHVV